MLEQVILIALLHALAVITMNGVISLLDQEVKLL